jgi:hypothetical protein
MVSVEYARALAIKYPEVLELSHIEKISFRIKSKIFLTINPPYNRACVKLSPMDQDVFCSFNKEVIYPVPNAWGKNGWTLINLKKVRKTMFKDILNSSFVNVAPKKISEKFIEIL